jgi:hypothetical protein
MGPDLDAVIREARAMRESTMRMRESDARLVERARALYQRVERFLADHPADG